MTAPDMVSVIAKVIADNSITFNDSRDYGELTASTLTPNEMARAVLAAISEAGSVEWGVAWSLPEDNGTSIYAKRTSAESVTRNLREAGHVAEAVTRITTPWTAVEA